VLTLASDFKSGGTLATISEICYWIKDNLSIAQDPAGQTLFARHINEILESRKVAGCHDIGVVFAALARARGLTVNYMQTFNIEDIQNYQRNPQSIGAASGHVFCDVWLDDHWVLVDPGAPCYYEGYDLNNKYFPGVKVIYKKGLDSWDIGIKSFSDMTKATREVVERGEILDYLEPSYQKVVLPRGLKGQAVILRVKVIKPGSSPCDNLEVDLWTSSAPPGGPDAGFNMTGINGVVTFLVSAGDYKIGFNLSHFPQGEFIFPIQLTAITLKEGVPVEITIQLQAKE
jgi:hypothetical protein